MYQKSVQLIFILLLLDLWFFEVLKSVINPLSPKYVDW